MGAQVFSTTDYENGWDGNFANSKTADQGVYVWVVDYDDIQGYNHLKKGNVMLVR